MIYYFSQSQWLHSLQYGPCALGPWVRIQTWVKQANKIMEKKWGEILAQEKKMLKAKEGDQY